MLGRLLIALLLAVPTASAPGPGERGGVSSTTSPTAAASPLPRRLKIVTYNILSCRGGLEQIAKFLREQDADVICLQEVARDAAPASGPAGADPGRRGNQAVRLAEMLGGWHVVSATTLRLPADQDCNVAILSRYPIHDSAAYAVEKRGYVYAVRATLTEEQPARNNAPASAPASQPVEPRPKQLHLFSVHLHSTHRLETKHIMESTRTRLAEVAHLLDTIRELPGDLIVAGDFNATPWMPEYLAMTEVLTDLGSKGADESPTFPTPHPSLRIDYIYGRGPLAAKTYRAVNVPWSDHLPVVAEILRSTGAEDGAGKPTGQHQGRIR